MNEIQLFKCDNGHTTEVYSSDPFYPEWVECQECSERMQHDGWARDS